MFHLVSTTWFVIDCIVVSSSGMEWLKDWMCVKVCFKVREIVAETHNMLFESYDNDALRQTTAYEWFKHFKTGRWATADLQLQDPNLWLHRRRVLSIEIINWLSKKLQKRLEYPLVHDTLCQDPSLMITNCTDSKTEQQVSSQMRAQHYSFFLFLSSRHCVLQICSWRSDNWKVWHVCRMWYVESNLKWVQTFVGGVI
jgi:hypothetical protein